MDAYNASSLLILNTLRTAIIISNEDGQILWANTASEELFATSNKRLQKYNVHDLFAPANHSAKLSRYTANLTPNLQPVITHDKWISGTQQPILVDYCISFFDNSVDKDVFCAVSVEESLYMVEVWAKNRYHQISQEQNQQAQYNLAKNMLRSVAHEVKNPLAGIRGAGQLLTKHLQRLEALDDKTQVYSDIIISETDRLTALINELMGVKHLTGNATSQQSAVQENNNKNYSTHFPNRYQQLNIHQSLEQVLNLIQSESNATDMTVSIIRDYDLSLPEIRGDANRLIQVFLNLAKNASEAMQSRQNQNIIEDGTNKYTHATNTDKRENQYYQPILTVITRVEFRRTIGKTIHKQVAKISMIDNGDGIADELKGQVFFPLVTNKAEGTGLGLSVVHDIISQHQGQIEVESRYGHTAFHVYLPFYTVTSSFN